MTPFPGDRLPGRRSGPSPERNAHYAEAASWAADIHGALRASRRVAWIIAGAAVLVAVLEALALAALTPLKTVVPYTILVDRQTGYVQTVQGLKPGPLTENAAVTQSFLVQYVIARETFDAADLVDNYRKVMLWSAENARNAYRQEMAKTNPTSPLVVNTPATIVQTTIQSVSLLSPTTALVRFETTRRDAGGGAGAGDVRDYAAVLSFRYTGAPMRMEDRFTNPLGFQVLSYRRDAETAPGVAAARPAGATAP
jgi:type IV secretion system protein VirB8